MIRRSFLASTGVLAALCVSGCLESDVRAPGNGDETQSDDDANSSGDDDPQEDMYPLIEPDPLDGIDPLAYDVSITSEATTDSPLTIDVALTNTGEETITYGERRDAMFWTAGGDDDFSLYPKGSVEDQYEYDDVWWLPDGFATTMDYQTATIEPGATHTETLALLHGPVDDTEELRALPPSLDFGVEFGYSADEDDTMPNGTDVSWGFHLRLGEE
ncbi:hypothetical protein [Natranaeroarchaeum aerophilus]|uniref:Uncharacterized protein n=1 Tax=Natranaeroarchaeum aerophilus TaxID=2917711 RepID=A0AAE3K5P3_9EURY|nr:hypothetical protein [Natranaeroarchaeum aerophilus]MCL9814136.1 hypothetical protein [Natranaeroarchaeum aerophilus]